MTTAAPNLATPTLGLSLYFGDLQPALPPVTSIPLEHCKPFIGNSVKLHFTIAVPLELFIEEGYSGVLKAAHSVFDKSIRLKYPGFRAVGAIPGLFDKTLSGQVLLQCICSLDRA